MNIEQARKLKAETHLSITDGAPPVVELECGVSVRIPAAMDYRILAAVEAACGDDIDNIDVSVIMLYCALHITRRDIGKLWKAARQPKRLYDDVMLWLAGQEASTVIEAANEIAGFQAELAELQDDGGSDYEGGDSGAKKKTGAPST